MNASELNKVLETEIRKLKTSKARRAQSIAIQKLASTMIGAARLELQFARQSGAIAHSPFYRNGRAALTNGRKHK